MTASRDGHSRPRSALLAGVVLLALVGAAGCSDDADGVSSVDPSTSATGGGDTGVTSAVCGEAIPDTVIQDLGWTSGGAAGAHVGRCERSADGGRVVVGTVATVDSAQATYDDRCATLPGDPGATMVDWLGDHTACATSPDDSSGATAGVTEVYVLVDRSVVQIRVEALQPLDTEALHSGIASLLDATEPVLDRF